MLELCSLVLRTASQGDSRQGAAFSCSGPVASARRSWSRRVHGSYLTLVGF